MNRHSVQPTFISFVVEVSMEADVTGHVDAPPPDSEKATASRTTALSCLSSDKGGVLEPFGVHVTLMAAAPFSNTSSHVLLYLLQHASYPALSCSCSPGLITPHIIHRTYENV